MNRVYQVKGVGLCFNNPSHKVKAGDYVILKADEHNEFDEDAVAIYNSDSELIGHVANSERTLSPNNRKNGNISASELKGEIDFSGKEFYGEVIKAFSSCLYLEVNEGKWSYINKPVPDLTFKRAIDLLESEVVEVSANEVDVIEPASGDVSLMSEIIELKSMVSELLAEVKALRLSIGDGEGDNAHSKPSERMLYAVVGLSHFDGQDNLGGTLTIVEEPIFAGAKGTALYLKSGDYRVGVFPSEKKREYCEEHKIPYYENKMLKNKEFGSDIRIEELVYDEYVIISV